MNLKDYKNIYMCGIGGISMSGLAEILKYWGFNVSGSDGMQSKMTDHLVSKGINVIIGQKSENVTEDITTYAVFTPKTYTVKFYVLNELYDTKTCLYNEMILAISSQICS